MPGILQYNFAKPVEVFIADTFMKRFMGYMFRTRPHYKAILIEPCNSIHTFFMRFDIDVLFIDENMQVIKKLESVGPGRVVMPVRGAKAVIEGEAGIFRGVQLGDIVREVHPSS